MTALGGAVALFSTTSLPELEAAPKPKSPVPSRVVKHAPLPPIFPCAIFRNLAFAFILVTLAPRIQHVYNFDPWTIGIALAAFGAGAFGMSLLCRLQDVENYASIRPPVTSV